MITKEHIYKGFRIVTDKNLYAGDSCYFVSVPYRIKNIDYRVYYGYFEYARQNHTTCMDKMKDVKASIDAYLKSLDARL